MADKIVVHFRDGDKKLRAEVDPAKVKAVLILTNTTVSPSDFAGVPEFGITNVNFNPPTLPEGIKVRNGNGTDPITNVSGLNPGVCYWVEDQLVCW